MLLHAELARKRAMMIILCARTCWPDIHLATPVNRVSKRLMSERESLYVCDKGTLGNVTKDACTNYRWGTIL